MMQNPIEQFLSGQAPSTGLAPVSDSRELLMDKLDDILNTSIADLTRADTKELFDAMDTVVSDLEHHLAAHRIDAEDAFQNTTTKAVQLMGLVIAVYAQALETEYERVADSEDEEVSDSA